jgi:ABC-type multidrug transport system fused ATPase/permease subunit
VSDVSTLSRLFGYAHPYRTRLGWAVVAMVIYAAGSAALAALIKTIFDIVLPHHERVGLVAWAVVLANLLKGIGSYGSSYLR